MEEAILVSMSLIYIRNIRGPRTVPWGTPDKTFFRLDVHPSTKTLCILEVSQVAIHL